MRYLYLYVGATLQLHPKPLFGGVCMLALFLRFPQVRRRHFGNVGDKDRVDLDGVGADGC